jgi:hypothetical protein
MDNHCLTGRSQARMPVYPLPPGYIILDGNSLVLPFNEYLWSRQKDIPCLLLLAWMIQKKTQ